MEENALLVASPCFMESMDLDVDCIGTMHGNTSATLDGDVTVMVALPPLLQSHPSMAYVYLFIVTLASSVGTVGNCLIIAAFAMSQSVRSSGNEFLLNLAFADLCVTLIADPMCVIGESIHIFLVIMIHPSFRVDH